MRHIILLTLSILLTHPTTTWAEEEKSITLPPPSLAQWYKPANKRQVWLHTMFSLRREMQAVTEYANEGDAAGTRKWGQRLVDHYRKIPEMVPEWQDELNLEAASLLEQAMQDADFDGVARATKKLGNTCNSCHREFRALAAAFYRTPDYSTLEIQRDNGATLGFTELMGELSLLVNRIKIAAEDEKPKRALESLTQLQKGLALLGSSCGQCHADPEPRERILGKGTGHTLNQLAEAIDKGEAKQTGRLLGEAAVIVCARCHGVHRTLGDLKRFLEPPGPY
jgi:mono/diheme cytochrome c family protein